MSDYEEKFKVFIGMINKAKQDDVDVVAGRWVIGDTADEIKESEKRLQEAGLKLVTVDGS